MVESKRILAFRAKICLRIIILRMLVFPREGMVLVRVLVYLYIVGLEEASPKMVVYILNLLVRVFLTRYLLKRCTYR